MNVERLANIYANNNPHKNNSSHISMMAGKQLRVANSNSPIRDSGGLDPYQ
jgi:hypothetical protein